MLDSIIMLVGVFVVAFLFAPVGMGGGMLFAPLLHYVADWPIDSTLLAVSLGLTWAVSIGSGLRHRKEGMYDSEATRSALVGAVIGALLGVAIVAALGEGLDMVFKLLSVAMLGWALRKTYWKLSDGESTRAAGKQVHENQTVRHGPLRLGAGAGGALSSVLGIGAGVIYVPVLQQSAGLEPRTSIGSSLSIMMVVVPIAVATLLFTSQNGALSSITDQPWWFYALPFVAYGGATAGAHVGIQHISTTNIMRVFMALIAVILLRYVVDLASVML